MGNHIKKITERKPDSYPEHVVHESNARLIRGVIAMVLMVLNQSSPYLFEILKAHFLRLNSSPENDVPLFVLT
jgi:hypothetical protein